MSEANSSGPPWTIEFPFWNYRGAIAEEQADDYELYKQYLERGFCNMDEKYKDLFDHGCYRPHNLTYLWIGLGVSYGLLILCASVAMAMPVMQHIVKKYGKQQGEKWAQSMVVLGLLGLLINIVLFVLGAVFAIPAFVGWILQQFWSFLSNDVQLHRVIGQKIKACFGSDQSKKSDTLPRSAAARRTNADGFEMQKLHGLEPFRQISSVYSYNTEDEHIFRAVRQVGWEAY